MKVIFVSVGIIMVKWDFLEDGLMYNAASDSYFIDYSDLFIPIEHLREAGLHSTSSPEQVARGVEYHRMIQLGLEPPAREWSAICYWVCVC